MLHSSVKLIHFQSGSDYKIVSLDIISYEISGPVVEMFVVQS